MSPRGGKPVRPRSRAARRRPWGWMLVAVAAVAGIAITVYSRRASTLGPGRAGVLAVPEPDTTGMEVPIVEVLAASRRAVLENPGSADAWGYFATVLDAHDLFHEAEIAYRRALEIAPNDLRYAYNLAVVLETHGTEPQEILDLYGRFAEREPKFPPVHFRIGGVLAKKGDLKGAAEAQRTALALDPGLTIARRALGQVLLALDDAAGAIAELEQVAREAPADGRTQAALAQAFTRLGNAERASAAAARVGALVDALRLPDPVRFVVTEENRSSTASLARAEDKIRTGDYAGAVRDLLIVLRSRPTTPGVHVRLADAYQHLGQMDQAQQHRREAQRLRDEP